jgi:hypothetical protein
VQYLAKTPAHNDAVGAVNFVVLTDSSGASRVYETKGMPITDFDGDTLATDSAGNQWRMEEAYLQAEDGSQLFRLPAHRAFWFGWFAAFNHTRLVH